MKRRYSLMLALVILVAGVPNIMGQTPLPEETLLAEARLLLEGDDLNGSTQKYEQFLADYPESENVPIVLRELGDAYRQQGNYTQSASYYTELLERNANLANGDTITLQLGVDYLNLEEFPLAIARFNEVIDDYPGTELVDDAKFRMADVYWRKYDFNQARTLYENFVADYPNSEFFDKSNFRVADSHQWQGDYIRALREYDEFLAAFPASDFQDEAYCRIADAHLGQGDYELAIIEFREFSNQFPNSGFRDDAQFYLAYSLYEAGEIALALAEYYNLITDYPNSDLVDKAKIKIITIRYGQGDYEEVGCLADEVCALTRDQSIIESARKYQGRALLMRAKRDRAENGASAEAGALENESKATLRELLSSRPLAEITDYRKLKKAKLFNIQIKYYLEDYAGVIADGSAFLALHPEPDDAWADAQIWTGIAKWRGPANDVAGATAAFELVMNAMPPGSMTGLWLWPLTGSCMWPLVPTTRILPRFVC